MGSCGERQRRYGEGRGTRGETHKAAYVSSVMRTGDFSFRARECKRKMKARSFFSYGEEGEGNGCRRWRRHHCVYQKSSPVSDIARRYPLDQRPTPGNQRDLMYKAESDHERK